jgi:4,5-dihydroxyphthalate decarboxylase
MLRSGEIDAAAGLEPADYPEFRTLMRDAAGAEADFVRQTGIRPINHGLVVRQDLAAAHPWLGDELARMVRMAKQASAGYAPPDGLEVNRGALTLLARYAFEQHITPHTLAPEELFSVT